MYRGIGFPDLFDDTNIAMLTGLANSRLVGAQADQDQREIWPILNRV